MTSSSNRKSISELLRSKYGWTLDSKQPLVIQSLIAFVVTYCIFAAMDSSGIQAANIALFVALSPIMLREALALISCTLQIPQQFAKTAKRHDSDSLQQDTKSFFQTLAPYFGMIIRAGAILPIIWVNQSLIPQIIKTLGSYLPVRHDPNSISTFLIGLEVCLIYIIFQWTQKKALKTEIKRVIVCAAPTLLGFLVGGLGFPWGVPVLVGVIQLVIENPATPQINETNPQSDTPSF